MQRFRNIFYQLNYDVIMAQNLDHVEFTDFLIKLSKDRALGNHCAIVIMILSHGTNKNF
jgi:hypothetical protein